MPATVWFANGTNIKENLRYKYDSYGNIAQIMRSGDKIVSHEYDSLNRLARENNKPLNKTVLYSYDTNGNILSRCEYSCTVKDNEELSELTCKHFDYIYEGDRLIKILSSDGEEQFAYNNLGSPTTYRNAQLQWQYGRLLTKYGETTFEYDGLGRRIKKGNINYIYDSEGKLQYSSDGVQYLYDDKGVVGFVEPAVTGLILYRKDAQGNIIAMLDSDGAVVVRYEYDAWGNHKVLDANGQEITDPEHIGHKNPFRYRGYFFDEETGLYYLQTRYYDPTIGRFISQDSIEYADPQSINGLNLYAYCNNNPVMNIDPTGNKWWEFWKWNWKEIGLAIAAAVVIVAAVAVTVAASIVTGGVAGAALMAVATGMAFGAIGGGISAAINGTSVAAGILGGGIKGAATGFALGVGIITGAGALSLAVGAFAFGAALTVNFVAGMAEYAIDSSMNGKSVNWSDAFANGGLQLLSGAFSFVAGTIIGVSGFFKIPGGTKLSLGQSIGNFVFGQFVKFFSFYPFNYIFNFWKK